MFFFFFFNSEERLGFKKLSITDLGLGDSHQTHIGLYEGVLTFLKNSDEVRSAMLIYNDFCEMLDCSFDRIQNPDGTYRSPKIRVGADRENSIVTKIREFAKKSPNSEWYLLWCGLESEKLTFWLIQKDSRDYNMLSKILSEQKHVYASGDPGYKEAIDLLTQKVNSVSFNVQKEIELASQIGDIRKRFNKIDIERADKKFHLIGRRGEELVDRYLERQKSEKAINSYVWENKSKESGLPFDFVINDKIYIDVKSTSLDFDQYIYFSNQEVNFASSKNDVYKVYRLFNVNESEAVMKICSNCNPYLATMDNNIEKFAGQINDQKAMLQSIKLGILPKNCFSTITSLIQL